MKKKKRSDSAGQFERLAASWYARGSLAHGETVVQSGQSYSLAGIPGAAQAFVLAAIQNHPGSKKPLKLALLKTVKAQEELANDLEAWGIPFLFFPQVEPIVGEALPDEEIAAERLSVLERLNAGFSGPVLATFTALSQPLPLPSTVEKARLKLKIADELDREAWLKKIEAAGYQREAEVTLRGTYSVRGAVVDFFSWHAQLPVRSEWMGDEVVSLREFDPVAQRSVRELPEAVISLMPLNAAAKSTATLLDYLPADTIRFSLDPFDPASIAANAGAAASTDKSLDALAEAEFIDLEFFAHDFLHAPVGDFILQEQRRTLFLDHLRDWMSEKWEIIVFCNNEGEQKRLVEIITEAQLPADLLRFVQRPLLRGFVWPQGKLVILSDAEVFGRYQTLRALRKQERLVALRGRAGALDFSDIQEGDYVVHLHHGIAFYRGLQKLPAPTEPDPKENKDGNGSSATAFASNEGGEVLVLEFAESSKLYVPVEQAYLVSKYIGVGKKNPPLDTLGGSRWERAKTSARKAVMDYAAELIRVQAERESVPGHAFNADTPWQDEFESAFFYEETPDQLKAIIDAKRDMEKRKPMDRLICGDVGFGKTEVAIRAAFKAVMDGKQVAFLVPTTVLAQQHYNTLRERFADYPIHVEVLSRFRSLREQKKVVADLKEGTVDVIVGTHRLISKDVEFKDLGLVVVDEEQRFGVVHKERFKQRFRLVDVLTLSATPIPRTLYLSLIGARDLSTIETPPANRVAVETIIGPYDERVIREAIRREIARNGQIYFLHNRINSLQALADRVKLLVPEARVDIGHGQMEEGELEEVMTRFVAGETDVLLSTTIIESGLDIPNANTILIDRADRFGLADLYQLRGRVGRAQHKAYAYLFLPRHLMTVGDARKRVSAIRQYSQLGAGFKIAMRDLEIRGAGNLLGTAQSGHITAVGFELYCQLLKVAVEQLKSGKVQRLAECKLDFDFLSWSEDDPGRDGAYVPRTYMSESRYRIEAYRKIAELRSFDDIESLAHDWKDRNGPLPPPAQRLLLAARIRVQAARVHISRIETQNDKLVVHQGGDFVMIGGKFPRLTGIDADSKLAEINQWIAALAGTDPLSTGARNA